MLMLDEKAILYLQDLVKCGIKAIERIPTGKFNISFFIKTEDKGEYVLRIAPPENSPLLFYERNMILQEPFIYSIVKKNTSIPIAEVVYFDGDGKNPFQRPFIIFTKLAGRPCSEVVTDLRKIKYQLGMYLAELHSRCTAYKYGYIGPHKPMEEQNTWQDAFRVMWEKLINDIYSIGMYTEKESNLYKDLLSQYISYFAYNRPASLCHMDIWAQNILVDADKITGIVDWDRALFGDPEIDLSVVEYCGFIDRNFWEGYGKTPSMDRAYYIRRIFYFLYEHQKYIFIRKERNQKYETARAYLEECRAVFKRIIKGHFNY